MEKLTKLSLLCSLAGIAALYGASLNSRPGVVPIASLDNNFVGLRVAVSGEVIDSREHADGHLFLRLKDDSGGVVSVPVFARVRSGLGEPIELLDTVQVVGVVKFYNEELEVIPNKPEDVRVVHSPSMKVSDVGDSQLGRLVKVQGVVVEREIVGKGSVILTLGEDGAELPVFVPASIVANGFPELHVGYTVRVGGEIQLYRERLELKLRDASHIAILEAA